MRKMMMSLFVVMTATASTRADFATATFEDKFPGANSSATNFSATNNFTSDGFTFSNHYTPPSGGFGSYYSGFGVSSRIDNTLVNDPFGSSDYDHALGAYAPQPIGQPGTGSGGSATYSVAFNYSVGDATVDLPTGYAPSSIDIANTTYMASSLKYGDAFSDPISAGQFVRLDIFGFAGAGATGAQVGLTSFYLADYRNGATILRDHFTTVDLTAFLGAKSLGFRIDTNIANSFGPSIPYTFAVDNVVGVRSVPEPTSFLMLVIGCTGLGIAARRRVVIARRQA